MSTNRHPIEQEELMAYLDGELSPDQATEALSHLEVCPECQALAADFRGVSQELLAWEVESPEVSISSELNAVLGECLQKCEAAKVSSSKLRNRVMTSRWVWAGALAIVCVAVGLKLTSFRIATPRSLWREALPRQLYPATQRSWSSSGGAMRPPSKERTVLFVWWNDHGCPHSTPLTSGTPKCVCRNVSIRQLRDPFCPSRSSGRIWY